MLREKAINFKVSAQIIKLILINHCYKTKIMFNFNRIMIIRWNKIFKEISLNLRRMKPLSLKIIKDFKKKKFIKNSLTFQKAYQLELYLKILIKHNINNHKIRHNNLNKVMRICRKLINQKIAKEVFQKTFPSFLKLMLLKRKS